MGLTPLEGLIMGTRSGDIDPAIVSFIADKEGITADEVVNILNKKSGVLGLSGGISSDFRDLGDAAEAGNEMAKNTLDAYAYRVACGPGNQGRTVCLYQKCEDDHRERKTG